MWFAGCVMQYLPSHPYAGSDEDPYDEFRFRSVLDNEGALGVYLDEEERTRLANALMLEPDDLKKNSKEFVFRYHAPFGKLKERRIFLAVIPPRKNVPSPEATGQAQE